MSKLSELIAEHGARIAALEPELAACKQELAEARRTIERLNTPVELSTWQKMEQELAEARKEIACLTNEVDALHGSRDQVAEERDRLHAEIETLRAQYNEVAEALGDPNVNLVDEVKKLKSDNADLNEAITGALKDRDYFSSQLATAQAEIVEWRKWEAGQKGLTWQTGTPPRGGWYWIRLFTSVTMGWYSGYNKAFSIGTDWVQCKSWAGPILPPQEPK